MNEINETNVLENELQEEETFEEVKEMRTSGSLKGGLMGFVAGVITCGIGALAYKHKMKKAMAEEFDDSDDFEDAYEEEDYSEPSEVTVNEEDSSEEEN